MVVGHEACWERCQRKRECYKDIFPCLGRSNKGEMYVFCSTCERDFSCASGWFGIRIMCLSGGDMSIHGLLFQ
jgi:hypothetical protein